MDIPERIAHDARISMHLMCRTILAVALCAAGVAPGAPAAPALRADVLPLVPRPRSLGPMPVELLLTWDGTGLLQGNLELEIRDGNRVLCRYRTADLALTTGTRRMHALLPPLPVCYEAQAEVKMWFVSGTERRALPPQFLATPRVQALSFVMAVCQTGATPPDSLRELEQSLRVERFKPQDGETPPRDLRELLTLRARLPVEDLPVQPLAYCAYDLLVLPAAAFKALHERQAQALSRWLAAGGSVCLLADGPIESERLALLNGWNETARRFEVDAGGRLQPEGFHRLHVGLGRLAVVTRSGAPGAEFDSAEWRRTVAFLWKLRRDATDAILRRGQWPLPPAGGRAAAAEAGEEQIITVTVPPSFPQAVPPPLPEAQGMASRVAEQLMPASVQMVPFSVLAGVMVLFALVIGPLEWVVLGRLKCRRMTWFTFPAVTLVFAGATVKLADHYLGRHDQRRSLVIVDAGARGAILRTDRYELVFAGRDRTLRQDWRDALWSSLGETAGTDMQQYYRQIGRRYRRGYEFDGALDSGDAACRYEGSLPGRYRTVSSVRQWRPALQRILTLDPAAAPPLPIRWDALERYAATRDLTKPPAEELITGLRGRYDVYVSRGRTSVRFPGPAMEPLAVIAPLGMNFPAGDQPPMARRSPTGGASWGDLPVLDTSDAGECLVAIATRVGDDIVVYRRIFHGND